MGRLECERREGYTVCRPRGRSRGGVGKRAAGVLTKLGIALLGLLVYLLPFIAYSVLEGLSTGWAFEAENNVSKMEAVAYLNKIRLGEGVPPVQLIDLNVPKVRAGYLADTNLFSHYDAVGRHPVYWYTVLDGGLHGVEENLLMRYTRGGGGPSRGITKVNYTQAVHVLVFEDAEAMWGHRDSLLDPCHNYVAMATSYFWNGTFGARYYVV